MKMPVEEQIGDRAGSKRSDPNRERLSREEIMRQLPQGVSVGQIHFYESVDSTNDAAKRAAAGGVEKEALFVADRQTAGRGRRGRVWSSPGGKDLFFSLLLRPALAPAKASMLTLLAALAASRTAEKVSRQACRIKWPNDIVLHERKICGILTEMEISGGDIDYVVLGLGFNLNRMTFDTEIADMATSIKKETGIEVLRAAFLADYLKEFMADYRRFLKEKSLRFFMDDYNARLINAGRQVKFVRDGHEQVRLALGIDEGGRLLLEDEEGRKETVLSGEVSVRGLYGYV